MQLFSPSLEMPGLAYVSCCMTQWQHTTADPSSHEPGLCPLPGVTYRNKQYLEFMLKSKG